MLILFRLLQGGTGVDISLALRFFCFGEFACFHHFFCLFDTHSFLLIIASVIVHPQNPVIHAPPCPNTLFPLLNLDKGTPMHRRNPSRTHTYMHMNVPWCPCTQLFCFCFLCLLPPRHACRNNTHKPPQCPFLCIASSAMPHCIATNQPATTHDLPFPPCLTLPEHVFWEISRP